MLSFALSLLSDPSSLVISIDVHKMDDYSLCIKLQNQLFRKEEFVFFSFSVPCCAADSWAMQKSGRNYKVRIHARPLHFIAKLSNALQLRVSIQRSEAYNVEIRNNKGIWSVSDGLSLPT